MGIQGRRCVTPNDVEASLKWLIEGDGPQLLEVVTDKKVPVLPMVPGGSGLHEFLVYDEGMWTYCLSRPVTNAPPAKEKERRANMKRRSGH